MRSELNVKINMAQNKKEIQPVILNNLVQILDISLSVMQKIPIPLITTINQSKSDIPCLHAQETGANSI